jgi:hypothetical protein
VPRYQRYLTLAGRDGKPVPAGHIPTSASFDARKSAHDLGRYARQSGTGLDLATKREHHRDDRIDLDAVDLASWGDREHENERGDNVEDEPHWDDSFCII